MNITHGNLENSFDIIRNKLIKEGKLEHLKTLSQLSEFALGKFLIENKGLNGYWIDYINRIPLEEIQLLPHGLEKWILQTPAAKRSQSRFSITTKILREKVSDNDTFLSIPSGVLGDLQESEKIPRSVCAVDIDASALLECATKLKGSLLESRIKYKTEDAWSFSSKEKYSFVNSHGLNIYCENPAKIESLYKNMRSLVSKGSYLLTSFLTKPPYLDVKSVWDISSFTEKEFEQQRIFFSDILDPKWENYSSVDEFSKMLKNSGFLSIEIIWDKYKMFPNVLAKA